MKEAFGEIFYLAKEKMKEETAGASWSFAIDNSKTNMSKEDLSILKNLDKLLGKTDANGQEVEIELMKKFIDTQIEKAEEEQKKNEKLCKNLGVIFGLAAVIILA